MKQMKDGWCGPTSLTYVAKHHGIPTTQRKVAALTKTTVARGAEPKQLVNGAKALGFTVSTIANKSSQETLNRIKRALARKHSVIVDYLTGKNLKNDGHYSVVKNISDKTISLWDPELGKTRSVPKEDFIASWKDTSTNGGIFSRWAMFLS